MATSWQQQEVMLCFVIVNVQYKQQDISIVHTTSIQFTFQAHTRPM